MSPDVPALTVLRDTADDAQRAPSQALPEWTIRDEANVLTAFAFRNGFLESLHAGAAGFADPEMRKLMIETSAALAQLLFLARTQPTTYAAFLRGYGGLYCRNWERTERTTQPLEALRRSCSSCARDVQIRWEYCPTCGASQRHGAG